MRIEYSSEAGCLPLGLSAIVAVSGDLEVTEGVLLHPELLLPRFDRGVLRHIGELVGSELSSVEL